MEYFKIVECLKTLHNLDQYAPYFRFCYELPLLLTIHNLLVEITIINVLHYDTIGVLKDNQNTIENY